jgi:hypothetical protein
MSDTIVHLINSVEQRMRPNTVEQKTPESAIPELVDELYEIRQKLTDGEYRRIMDLAGRANKEVNNKYWKLDIGIPTVCSENNAVSIQETSVVIDSSKIRSINGIEAFFRRRTIGFYELQGIAVSTVSDKMDYYIKETSEDEDMIQHPLHAENVVIFGATKL